MTQGKTCLIVIWGHSFVPVVTLPGWALGAPEFLDSSNKLYEWIFYNKIIKPITILVTSNNYMTAKPE